VALSPPLRRVLIGLGVLVALLVASALLLPSVVSLDRFRPRLVTALQSTLNRKVDVGRLRLQIFLGPGARVEDVVVHNPAGWKSPDLLRAGAISVRVALLPLLAGRIEVTRAVLSNVQITIERSPKGSLDVGELHGAGAPRTSERLSRAESLLVTRLEISGGRLVFVDRKAAAPATFTLPLEDIRGDVEGISPGSLARFSLAGRVASAGSARNLRLSGTLGPPPKEGLGGAPLQADLELRGVLLGQLWPYLGLSKETEAGRLDAKGTLSGPLGGPLDLRADVVLATGDAQASGTARLTADWSRPRFDLSFDLSSVSAKGVRLLQAGGRVEADLQADRSASATTRLELKMAGVDLGRAVDALTSQKGAAAGLLAANLTAASRGPGDFMKTAEGEGDLRIANVDLKSLNLLPEVARSLSDVGKIAGFSVPPSLEKAKFDSLTTRLVLKEGRLGTPGLTLGGHDVSATADGSIGLDGSLAYEGNVLVSADIVRSLGNAGRYLADEQGRMAVPFKVSGDLAAPKVSIGEEQLLGLARRALAQGAVERLGGDAGKIPGGLLPPPPARTPTPRR